MKGNHLLWVLPVVSLATSEAATIGAVTTDRFGRGAHQFTMEFVDIRGENVADDTGYGAVAYGYRMGVHEVSREMIGRYNALGGGPVVSMADMTSWGGDGPNLPATGVSWNEAARFVNWLNTSEGHAPAYKFTGILGNDNIELWAPGDSGYNPSNPFRNSRANYFLPSEDEWYKAAYYDPSANGGAGGYWQYATGSDTAPTGVSEGVVNGTATYQQRVYNGPADITNAGGLSPLGTMAQNGNVWEWTESAYRTPNDWADESRVIRGGGWNSSSSASLLSSGRFYAGPTGEESFVTGFRVASVPEPSGSALLLLGALGLVIRRKR